MGYNPSTTRGDLGYHKCLPMQKWRQVRHNIKMWTFKLKATGSSNQVPIATDKDTSSKVTEVFVVSFVDIWEIHCFTRPLSSA